MYQWEEISHSSYPIDFTDIVKANENDPPGMRFLQYIGLKDKNGKEIYEGDILSMGKSGKYIVEYRAREIDPGFKIQDGPSDTIVINMSWNDGEIIGNIYENPELLK